MKKIKFSIFIILFICCTKDKDKLPYLGNPTIVGDKKIYPKIRDFYFINQDSNLVSNTTTFKNKIYIADFIFLNCPTICPKMNTELLKVYNQFSSNSTIMFLSHTIDPEHDSVSRLKKYTQINNIKGNWHFVTGNKDSIYSIATKSYYSVAYKDAKEPGGYVHSGGVLLVDKNRHIRGVYDGTNSKETIRLIHDISVLLKE